MRKKYFLIIVIIILISIVVSLNIYARRASDIPSAIQIELQDIMPEAGVFKKATEPFLYYEAYKKDKLIGHCFYTTDVAPEEQGFSGPIKILVALDQRRDIENLKVLSHNETPEYADGITKGGFLDQFKGKGAKNKFIVGEDIDAVTNATISSKAVSNILKRCILKMQQVLGGGVEEEVEDEIMPELKEVGLEPREAEYYKVLDE